MEQSPNDPLTKTFVPNCDTGDSIESTDGAAHSKSPISSPPVKIGRYELRQELGAGGFGTVYRAWDTELQRDAALKLPHAHVVARHGGAAQYVREARSLAQLKHPGIVAIYDFGHLDDGRCYLVTEFIAGQSLAQRLKSAGPMPPTDAAELMIAVAEALQHAHKQGFVHRDLKPANILLDAQQRPHIADFGLALHEDEQHQHAGEVSGTPAYMSPEQLQGAAHHLDGRTDVWSAGVILYELLTGRRPFPAKSPHEIADEIRHRAPKPLRMIDEAIPEALERVVFKCLEKRVEDRIATANDLAVNLQRTLSPVLGRPRRRLNSTAALGFLTIAISASLCMLLAWPSARNYFNQGPHNLERDADTQREPSEPALPPLRVDSFHVLHYRNDAGKTVLVGSVGEESLTTAFDDQVRVEVRLNQLARCYLIAFNPDGSVQLCHPAHELLVPHRLTALSFPDDPIQGFTLNDAVGQQVFALIASTTPLSAYADWRDRLLEPIPWSPMSPAGVLRLRGDLTERPGFGGIPRRATESMVEAPAGDAPCGGGEPPPDVPGDVVDIQGEVKPLDGPNAIEVLVRYLRERSGADVVEVMSFPVLPKPAPAAADSSPPP
jgi:serine/threonine protein kinase